MPASDETRTQQRDFDPSVIHVDVQTRYLPEQSIKEQNHYAFAYSISVSNHGDRDVQLLSRHWVITDADNRVQEVRGEGVVGEQPIIGAGSTFTYTSGASIATPVGFMQGSYIVATVDDGRRYQVAIDPFTLHLPNALH